MEDFESTLGEIQDDSIPPTEIPDVSRVDFLMIAKVYRELFESMTQQEGWQRSSVSLLRLLLDEDLKQNDSLSPDFQVLMDAYSEGNENGFLLNLKDNELVRAAIFQLKERFDFHSERHPRVDWNAVQSSLEADPAGLFALIQMNLSGHEPDVYLEDEKSFYIGTCSSEAPESARDLVFDAEAEGEVRKRLESAEAYVLDLATSTFFPVLESGGGEILVTFPRGNAKKEAVDMGVDLMPKHHYAILQGFGVFDRTTSVWLQTPEEIRVEGVANRGSFSLKNLDPSGVSPCMVGDHQLWVGFRGAFRVLKK